MSWGLKFWFGLTTSQCLAGGSIDWLLVWVGVGATFCLTLSVLVKAWVQSRILKAQTNPLLIELASFTFLPRYLAAERCSFVVSYPRFSKESRILLLPKNLFAILLKTNVAFSSSFLSYTVGCWFLGSIITSFSCLISSFVRGFGLLNSFLQRSLNSW